MIFISLNMFAQDKIIVSINKIDTYIETYKKSYSKNFILDEAYRLGPSSFKTLKEGVRTALKWIDINSEYNKTFEKEICRFKAMEKEQYKFHGYVDQFAKELILNFRGYSNGTFVIEIKEYDGYSTFIKLNEKYMVISFRDLLEGKSVNKEIDDIFKN